MILLRNYILLSLLFLFPVFVFGEEIDVTDELLFKTEESNYVKLSPLYQKDIIQIFKNYPIYTNITFFVHNVNDQVLEKMFIDLDYTAKVAKQFANSPYLIEDKNTYFYTHIPDKVEGEIRIIYTDKKNNRYVYLVNGYYDAFITLRGKMLIDIKYVFKGKAAQFYVKAYVIVTNSILWRLTRYFKNQPTFKKKIDNIFSKNVRFTIKIGRLTVYGIQSNLRHKNF